MLPLRRRRMWSLAHASGQLASKCIPLWTSWPRPSPKVTPPPKLGPALLAPCTVDLHPSMSLICELTHNLNSLWWHALHACLHTRSAHRLRTMSWPSKPVCALHSVYDLCQQAFLDWHSCTPTYTTLHAAATSSVACMSLNNIQTAK